jgi:hypothetical protein
MKLRALILAFTAFLMLVGGPFGLGTRCDSDPRGGLTCYCCADLGENCAMISCSGCCGGHAGKAATDSRPSVLVLEYFSADPLLRVAYGDLDTFGEPQIIYLDVPDKPPKHA